MVASVKSVTEFKESLKHDGLVIVDFYATWCQPCLRLAPAVDKFAKRYKTSLFIKVDIEEVKEIAKKYLVTTMPTFLLFDNGEIVQKVLGPDILALRKAINSSLKKMKADLASKEAEMTSS